jgi:hypothetical protein
MMRRPVLWKWKLAKMFGCFSWNSNTFRVSFSDIGYGQPSASDQPNGKFLFGSGPPMSSSLMRPSPSLSNPSMPRRRKRGAESVASATRTNRRLSADSLKSPAGSAIHITEISPSPSTSSVWSSSYSPSPSLSSGRYGSRGLFSVFGSST